MAQIVCVKPVVDPTKKSIHLCTFICVNRLYDIIGGICKSPFIFMFL